MNLSPTPWIPVPVSHLLPGLALAWPRGIDGDVEQVAQVLAHGLGVAARGDVVVER